MSLIITAFAPVLDVRKTVTPQLRTDQGDTELLLLDLGAGANRMGGSILAQVFSQFGDTAPDIDKPEALVGFFNSMQALLEQGDILAYHDRSDGGLMTTLAEMSFAGHVGIDLCLDALDNNWMAALFNEELGAVIQVRAEQADSILKQFASAEVAGHRIGRLN